VTIDLEAKRLGRWLSVLSNFRQDHTAHTRQTLLRQRSETSLHRNASVRVGPVQVTFSSRQLGVLLVQGGPSAQPEHIPTTHHTGARCGRMSAGLCLSTNNPPAHCNPRRAKVETHDVQTGCHIDRTRGYFASQFARHTNCSGGTLAKAKPPPGKAGNRMAAIAWW